MEGLYNRHFWRGVVDGDGYISFDTKKRLNLIGSKYITEQFHSFVKTLIDTESKVHKVRDYYVVEIGGKISKRIISYLYKDSNIYLDRKYEIAKKFMETIK